MSMIYFDNAATSFPKPKSVIKAVEECITHYCGNPGRSGHALSLRSAEEIYETREKVASFFGHGKPESVVFTYNATYAINIAIKSIIEPGSHVLTSDIEHNAVVRPLKALTQTADVELSEFNSDGDVYTQIKSLIRPNTTTIISTLKSNVTGKEIDPTVLSKVAEKNGLALILDASQYAGHKKIELSKIRFDAFCAPAHKGLFGIQGCGFVIFNSTSRKRSVIEGGSGSNSISLSMPMELPDGYEAGTLATPSIVSLKKGIEAIEDVGISAIMEHTQNLTNIIIEGLESIPGIKIFSFDSGIISFNIRNVPSSTLADHLATNGICSRSGLHCAPATHRKFGTIGQGMVRLSCSYLNTEQEAVSVVKAVRAIANII